MSAQPTRTSIYIFVVFLILTGVEKAVYWLNHVFKNKRLVHNIIIAMCVMWLLYPLVSIFQSTSRNVQNGAGGYSTVGWRESPLMEWMCINQLDGNVYSNAPDALYVIAGITAKLSPHRSRSIEQVRQSLPLGDTHYVVWFDNKCREYLYSLQDLTSLFELKEVVALADGGVYSIK